MWISCMDILHPWSQDTCGMAGLGVAICSYSMLGIWMYICRSDQTISWDLIKKIKTQHNLASDVHGSQTTYPMKALVTGMHVAAQYYQYTWLKNPSTVTVYIKLKYWMESMFVRACACREEEQFNSPPGWTLMSCVCTYKDCSLSPIVYYNTAVHKYPLDWNR